MGQQVWTFTVTGGLPFVLEMTATPTWQHDGERSLFKMMGTLEMAQQVAQTIRERSSARVSIHTEAQSPEQEAERRLLLGLGMEADSESSTKDV